VKVEIGVAFDGMLPLGEAVELARQAEAAGVRSLWVAEHLRKNGLTPRRS